MTNYILDVGIDMNKLEMFPELQALSVQDIFLLLLLRSIVFNSTRNMKQYKSIISSEWEYQTGVWHEVSTKDVMAIIHKFDPTLSTRWYGRRCARLASALPYYLSFVNRVNSKTLVREKYILFSEELDNLFIFPKQQETI